MLFKVKSPIFVKLLTSQATSSIFVSLCFSQVLMKELTCMLICIHKIFNCWMSFKMVPSMCRILLLRRDFKPSCDPVTFRMALLKNYHNSDGSHSHPNVLS